MPGAMRALEVEVIDDGALDVLSFANPASPLVIAEANLGVTGACQPRVSPDGTRARWWSPTRESSSWPSF